MISRLFIFCIFTFRCKLPDQGVEGTYTVRVLELFCETFNYPFNKLEDKLPLALLTNITMK